MKAPPSPDVRKGPGRGPDAGFTTVGNQESNTEPLHGQLGSARHVQDFADLDALIVQAVECEQFLARRAYRLRKVILNLEVYRDHLTELGRRLAA